MDVRERLVEIERAAEWFEKRAENTPMPMARKMFELAGEALREKANGVTVQEWISVKDRLPEHGDVVLCFMKFGEQRILQWDNVSNWWLGYGHGDDWQKADVVHWCCLPQPPKGE